MIPQVHREKAMEKARRYKNYSHEFIQAHLSGDMILVTDIEFMCVETDVHRIFSIIKENQYSLDIEELQTIQEEVIYGKRFRTPEGLEICLGIKQEVQDILGTPFNVIENLQTEIERLNSLTTWELFKVAFRSLFHKGKTE